MRHALPLVSFLVFVAAPCVVTAQPPGRGGSQQGRGGPPTEMIIQLFTQADVNNDGVVTKAELTAAMSSMPGGNRQGRGGPPNGGPPREEGNQQQGPQGQHGPPPRPG
ncbi:MAG: EF-hand domain-containing protein, partial [Rubripirellula sp.]